MSTMTENTVMTTADYSGTESTAPALKTNRGLVRFLLLSLVTLGIYPIFVFYTGISMDLNRIASPNDGRKTMNYLVMLLLSAITFGIAVPVWFHKMSARVGDELRRRGLPQTFGCSDYWLWGVLGNLIAIGPFVYVYKLCKAMNALAEDENAKR